MPSTHVLLKYDSVGVPYGLKGLETASNLPGQRSNICFLSS